MDFIPEAQTLFIVVQGVDIGKPGDGDKRTYTLGLQLPVLES